MRPAWHALLLLAVSCVCFAKTYSLDMHGKNLKITLNSNPSTGYTWELKHYDTKFLKFNGKEYIKSKSGLIGSPGQERFNFTVLPLQPLEIQHTKITLYHSRQWEHNTGEEINIIVNVRGIQE